MPQMKNFITLADLHDVAKTIDLANHAKMIHLHLKN